MKTKGYDKIVGLSMLILIMCLGMGCQNGQADEANEIGMEELKQGVSQGDNQVKQEKSGNKLDEEQFKAFFKNYFSFSDEELMVLNQKRSMNTELYQSNLENYYTPIIEEKIGEYLNDELREKIKSSYRTEEIDLPKWILINEYIVSGHGEVEAVDIGAVRTNGQETSYEARVITTHSIMPIQTFHSKYIWDDEAGYFITTSQEDNLLQETLGEQMEIQNYSLSESEDAMRLQQSFWITVNNEAKELKISRINTNISWGEESNSKRSVLSTQYITRLPYNECVSQEELQILEKLLTVIFEKDPQDYKNYESAYDNGYEMLEKVWEEWGLEDIIEMSESSYSRTFSKSILPSKDQIKFLKLDKTKISIQPSIYSTLKQPRFMISIPVQALLYNNQIVYYKYKYFVGMEKNKVEFIQFMSMNQIEELEREQ